MSIVRTGTVLCALALAGAAAPQAAGGALKDLLPLPDQQPPPPAEPEPEPAPAPAPGGERDRPARKRRRPRDVRLSDELRRSRWAYVRRRAVARRRPTRRSRRIKRLGTRTEDGTPELVLALRKRVTRRGRVWVKVRLPMRPNGRTGWVRRRDLGRLHTVRTALRINRRRQRAVLLRRGRRIWSAPIGVGKPQWPTPAGRFYVRELLLPTDPGGVYGVFAFGTSAYSGVLTDWPGGGIVGIHGTNQPGLIPGRISHGCIRLRNADIARLRRLMGLGTPIRIR